MNEQWKEVLLESRDAIIRSTDPHGVFLGHVLDYLENQRCINQDHVVLINAEILPRKRVGKLLDFVSSETAFDELCNAFRAFSTDDKRQLADKLQQDLRHKKEEQEIRDATEVQQLKAERDQLKTENNQLKTEKDQLEIDRDQLKTENKQLKIERDQIMTRLAFCTEPLKLIHLMDERKPICGLTILNNELYVLYRYTTDIKVHDTETYRVQRSVRVPRLGWVWDMTSCKRHQCIYMADHDNEVVHRVDNKNAATQWPVNDVPSGLSVNSVYNVLVTCMKVGKVIEFTADGNLIREIRLESSIVQPWHTVELTTGQLAICHGGGNDAVNRVCIVDLSGRVIQSYGGSPGSGSGQLITPVRLLAANGVILVSDLNNYRVVMLSPTLSFIREVLVSGLRYPLRMCFDDDTCRLYIGDNKWEIDKYVSGQVKVYGVNTLV